VIGVSVEVEFGCGRVALEGTRQKIDFIELQFVNQVNQSDQSD
jgi:hypothetical protein